MKLDFAKLQTGSTSTLLDPRKLFTTLPRSPRFKRPLDEQADVLDAWFQKRDQRDITVKMNTGAGKTLVGLLILQSSLNEGFAPAVYTCPDNHLAAQVIREATELGIAVTESDTDAAFLSGKSILVVVIHKLINGKSRFGVHNTKIPIGACIVDDAHACLATISRQFTIRADASTALYKGLFKLFKSDLEAQSPIGAVQIEEKDPSFYLGVPFWAWKRNLTAASKLLYQYREDPSILFSWPLLKDSLGLCQCAFGGEMVEIGPRCLPIDAIPSFDGAKRRVYMTATLADDGVLITRVNADPLSVAEPIRPKGVGDIGERMILVPQEINPQITDEEIRKLAVTVAKKHNVTVIVPSAKRVSFWKGVADQILDKDNIDQGVESLRKGLHKGITVLLNKYDGVDLPDDACRLLIIDGLPEAYGLLERIETSALDGTELQLIRQVQKIEQGMGRGVRSSEDYCAILLMGRGLASRLHLPTARAKFSSATQAQLDLGEEVASQIKGQSASSLLEVIDYCLSRNPDWVKTSRNRMANALDKTIVHVDPAVIKIRSAFNFAQRSLWLKAIDEMQAAVNMTSDKTAHGYLMLQLAEYMEQVDPVRAQETLLSAITFNSRLTKPIAGVTYSRLSNATADQATEAVNFMAQFLNTNDLSIWANAFIESLVWDEEKTDAFEAAVRDLGKFLGFNSQRPEVETGKGPDNLWAVGGQQYFVIECKSGSQSGLIGKKDCDQLTGAMQWFESNYGTGDSATPVLIHPHHLFDSYSSPNPSTRVIDKDSLANLKEKLRNYVIAIASQNNFKQVQQVGSLLKQFQLNAGALLTIYATHYKISKK